MNLFDDMSVGIPPETLEFLAEIQTPITDEHLEDYARSEDAE